MQVSYNTFPSETSILSGCDLTSHLLPDGYAVKTATLKMRLADYPSGTPTLGAWESRQHNWSESLLHGPHSTGPTVGELAEQKLGKQDYWTRSSRQFLFSRRLGRTRYYSSSSKCNERNRSVDLILGIVGVGSGGDRDALFYPNSANSANRLRFHLFMFRF